MATATSTTALPITRQQVEAQIDLLIDLLDALDDPDSEPSLGWTSCSWESAPQTSLDFCANANAGDDREEEDEREPPVDDEPSLGWTSTVNQNSTDWAANHTLGATDLERGIGPVRKARPASRTGNRVVVGWRAEVLL
jgi:hypothetical protein